MHYIKNFINKFSILNYFFLNFLSIFRLHDESELDNFINNAAQQMTSIIENDGLKYNFLKINIKKLKIYKFHFFSGNFLLQFMDTIISQHRYSPLSFFYIQLIILKCFEQLEKKKISVNSDRNINIFLLDIFNEIKFLIFILKFLFKTFQRFSA